MKRFIQLVNEKKNHSKRTNNLDFKFTFGIHLKKSLKEVFCPGGEIGRRTAFRWQRSQGCAGSNPVPGTTPLF